MSLVRPTCGEVGAGDVLHQLGDADVWVMDERLQACYNFSQVVGRDLGGNANSNPSCAVDQQVRHPSRQHCRLILQTPWQVLVDCSAMQKTDVCALAALCIVLAKSQEVAEGSQACSNGALEHPYPSA